MLASAVAIAGAIQALNRWQLRLFPRSPIRLSMGVVFRMAGMGEKNWAYQSLDADGPMYKNMNDCTT